MECDGGKTYKACGTSCPRHCYDSALKKKEGCTTTCVEGCHCPEGTVLHKSRCVKHQSCTCTDPLTKREYAPLTKVARGCDLW